MSHLETGYLPGPQGSLHISLFHPGRVSACSSWVLHVPAFGEEMNKSRHMVARQARALAAQGLTVLVPDLSGTGDSAGDLEQVTWHDWRADIAYLANWARGEGAEYLTLWGHRLGCLLAMEVAQDLPEPPQQLLFWQPVHSGKQHMTQFLRLRMAAGLTSGGPETVSQLRESLLQGESLEVAGYVLPGGLFSQIESVDMARMSPPVGASVRIYEVVSEAGKSALPITARLADQWNQVGIGVHVETVQGDPFWMTQELGFAPELIEKTSAGFVPIDDAREDSAELFVLVTGQAERSKTSQDLTQTLVFNCGNEQMVGVLHGAKANATLGVLIVVGGPQYRVGSHRQFVHLAQHLAGQGIPVFRFDYRGMGDSSGELVGFEDVNSDICCAIDAFQQANSGITDIVIWGLCDAATAAVFYAGSDVRVKGLFLANPWVYSDKGAAKAYLKHYYLQRLFHGEFWRKLLSGNFSVSSSIKSAWGMLQDALIPVPEGKLTTEEHVPNEAVIGSPDAPTRKVVAAQHDLVNRFTEGLAKFTGRVFFILSKNDLTAAEFIDATRDNAKLRKLMKHSNVSQVTLPDSDHTFSKEVWSREVETISLEFMRQF